MTDIVERLRAFGAWEKVVQRHKLVHEAADEIERLRERLHLRAALRAISEGALRDVLWGILTPDDGTAPPPNYTLVQLARDRVSDIERLRERLHYCNGVADDRWKEIEKLRAALRDVGKPDLGYEAWRIRVAREALGDE